jgi:hypothetical protein
MTVPDSSHPGAVANEIDIGVLGVRGPVPLIVLQEPGLVGRQPMHLEAAQRKAKSAIDATMVEASSAS